MRAALVSLVLLLSPPAHAQQVGESSDVAVTVHFQRPAHVESMCAMLMEQERGNGVIACSNPVQMFVPDPCLFSDRYARILCHELRCHVTQTDTHHLTRFCARTEVIR